MPLLSCLKKIPSQLCDLRLARGADVGELCCPAGEAVPGQRPKCASPWSEPLASVAILGCGVGVGVEVQTLQTSEAVANKVLSEQQNQLGKTVDFELRPPCTGSCPGAGPKKSTVAGASHPARRYLRTQRRGCCVRVGSSSPRLRNARNNIVEDRAYNTRAAKLHDATRLSRFYRLYPTSREVQQPVESTPGSL